MHESQGPSPRGDRPAELERLGRLRDAQGLDASEFEREKERILASGGGPPGG